MSGGSVAAVRKEIMKFIQYAMYWEKKTHTHKSQTKQMLQKTLFSLRNSNTHHNIPFNFQFFYELKAKGSWIREKFAWGFHFLFHLGFTKVYFYFEGVSKNCESVKKGKSFFLIVTHSMQGWTANTRHGVTRKRLKHEKIKASRKSL